MIPRQMAMSHPELQWTSLRERNRRRRQRRDGSGESPADTTNGPSSSLLDRRRRQGARYALLGLRRLSDNVERCSRERPQRHPRKAIVRQRALSVSTRDARSVSSDSTAPSRRIRTGPADPKGLRPSSFRIAEMALRDTAAGYGFTPKIRGTGPVGDLLDPVEHRVGPSSLAYCRHQLIRILYLVPLNVEMVRYSDTRALSAGSNRHPEACQAVLQPANGVVGQSTVVPTTPNLSAGQASDR